MNPSTLAGLVTVFEVVEEILTLIRQARERGDTTIDLSQLDEIFNEKVQDRLDQWNATESGEDRHGDPKGTDGKEQQ